MPFPSTPPLLAAVLLAAALGLSSCGSDDSAGGAASGPPGDGPPFAVTSSVISAEDTQEIGVWAPDADGQWPVVVGFHGQGGTHEAWDGLASELASRGVVVFVPDYRSTSSVVDDMKKDLVCGAHLAREVAAEYGGDLDQGYALIGHSLGASIVMGPLSDVREGTDGSFDSCFADMPDGPDAVVGMVGCYYESPDGDRDTLSMPVAGTPVTLIAGEDDATCEAWQSEDAAAALESAGYDTTLVVIPGGTHGTPLFLDDSQEPWVPVARDDPGGQQAVAAILAALQEAKS
jgi:alpha-beta hydrolase superfamily lysophospholipase